MDGALTRDWVNQKPGICALVYDKGWKPYLLGTIRKVVDGKGEHCLAVRERRLMKGSREHNHVADAVERPSLAKRPSWTQANVNLLGFGMSCRFVEANESSFDGAGPAGRYARVPLAARLAHRGAHPGRAVRANVQQQAARYAEAALDVGD